MVGRRAGFLLALVAAGLAAGTAMAQSAEGDVAAFRRLRAEAVAAARADDVATAGARLAEADARIASHPGLMLMRARVAVAAGDPEAALAQLKRYADAGLVVAPASDPALTTLTTLPGYAEVEARLAANRAPVGADRLSPLFQRDGAPLVESLAWDAARSRWLVSEVAGRTIAAVDDDGAATPYLQPATETGGVLGLAVDPAAGALWAGTAPLKPALHARGEAGDPPASALIRIDLETGRETGRYPAPGPAADHALGDLALAPDGTVHASDSISGSVYALPPGAEALTVLVAPGTLGSPQGIAVTPDGSGLIVADYSSGLWRVDRTTGRAQRLPAPADASLIGVDGLIRDGDVLYGFQNGVSPQRVLKLTPDAGWTRIDVVQVLAANLPEIDEPTTGLVLNGELVFVSRSQWSDFDDDGAPRTAAPEPARIVRLRLD